MSKRLNTYQIDQISSSVDAVKEVTEEASSFCKLLQRDTASDSTHGHIVDTITIIVRDMHNQAKRLEFLMRHLRRDRIIGDEK